MIPDFPMPPYHHGIMNSMDSDADNLEVMKPRIFHSFEKFSLPKEEYEDYGFADPLPFNPTVKQFFEIELPNELDIFMVIFGSLIATHALNLLAHSASINHRRNICCFVNQGLTF